MLMIKGHQEEQPLLTQHSLTLSSCSFMMSQVTQEWTWSETWMAKCKKGKMLLCGRVWESCSQLETRNRPKEPWTHGCIVDSVTKLGVNWGHFWKDHKDKPLVDDSEKYQNHEGDRPTSDKCLFCISITTVMHDTGAACYGLGGCT